MIGATANKLWFLACAEWTLMQKVLVNQNNNTCFHYGDVIMGAIVSQITSLTIVYSTVYSDADHRKHQSSASLAFVCGIHRGPVNSPHKWPVTRKMFPFDDVIMFFRGFCGIHTDYSSLKWSMVAQCQPDEPRADHQQNHQYLWFPSCYNIPQYYQDWFHIIVLKTSKTVSYIGIPKYCEIIRRRLCWTLGFIQAYVNWLSSTLNASLGVRLLIPWYFIMIVVTIIGFLMAILIILNCTFRLSVTK